MVASACGQRSPNFPPGWNGLATKPPMGWRSWNAWGNRVSQDLMTNAIDALTARSWTVDGRNNVSLFEAGYNACGIDEGWEGCGAGINGTQHDAAGLPTVNAKFPNTSALVEHGHSKGLLMGWVRTHNCLRQGACAKPRRSGALTHPDPRTPFSPSPPICAKSTRTAVRVASGTAWRSTTRAMFAAFPLSALTASNSTVAARSET